MQGQPKFQKPSLGRIVIFRSRTGDYDVPAIITATQATLNPKGVELGHIPRLSSPSHVHLTCFTAGVPGKRRDATDFKVESEYPRSENVAGTRRRRRIASGTERRCRECGCTDHNACIWHGATGTVTCTWHEPDLCTACAPGHAPGWNHPPVSTAA